MSAYYKFPTYELHYGDFGMRILFKGFYFYFKDGNFSMQEGADKVINVQLINRRVLQFDDEQFEFNDDIANYDYLLSCVKESDRCLVEKSEAERLMQIEQRQKELPEYLGLK